MSGRGLAALLLMLAQGSVQAGIYTHVDPNSGMTVMSNIANNATPAPKKNGVVSPVTTATPGDFPRVSKQRQSELDGGRRAILDTELASERQALSAAAGRRAEQAILHRHQANIEALQRELQAMR